MAHKRILLIADVNSMFTYSFVKKMCELDMELVIINQAVKKIDGHEYYYQFCEENNICVKSFFNEQEYSRCLKYTACICNMKPFDICYIMFFSFEAALISKLCERQFNRIIVNYWGSDFYRTTPVIEKYQRILLEDTDQVIVPVEDMKDQVLKKYPFLLDRVNVVAFRSPVMSALFYEESISENISKSIPLNHDKIIVMCGYSGSPEQQHSMMIQALNNSSKELQSRIFVVFMMTYGLTQEYKSYLARCLEDVDFEYIILQEYLSDMQVVYLRQNTDIFVYAETTDAYSATVQENLYCGVVCLVGSWLRYRKLEEREIFMCRFDDQTSLQIELEKIILNLPLFKKRSAKNKQIMKVVWNGNLNMENWADYYNGENNKHKQVDTTNILLYVQRQEQIQINREYMYHQIIHKWLEKRIDNIEPVCEYVQNRHYKKILIYGAGTLGKLVYQELKHIDGIQLNVCDRDAKPENVTWLADELLRPHQLEIQEYDSVLITPIHIFEQIIKDFGDLKERCISLFDVVMG